MANTTLPRYSPSGFFRPTTFALFIAAIGGGVLVAWLYQLLMRWIPFIYLNAIICAGFGAALGVGGTWAVKSGHCRNRIIALLFALPLFALPLAASYWWDYRHVLSEVAEKNPSVPMEEIQREVTFQRYIDAKVETGWSVSSHGGSGSQFNGKGVYFIWGIEALILFGIVVFMVNLAVGEPYCERCNQWANEKKMLLPGLSAADADPLLAQGDLDAVIGLQPPAEPDLSMAITMTAAICPGCRDTGFLTVEEKRVLSRKKGKAEEKTKVLISNAVLRADQRAKFLARLEPPATAPVAAAQ
jgi:hypothetical protein